MVSRARVGERVGVAEGHRHEPGGERAEPGPGLGVAREAGDGRRAPVEVAGAHDDRCLIGRDALDRVPPSPDHLDRGLHGFGPGVHGHHHLHAAELGEVAAERLERVGPVGAARQRELRQLSTGGRDQPGMAVPEVQRGVRGEEIEVPASVVVLDPGAASRAAASPGAGRSSARSTHRPPPRSGSRPSTGRRSSHLQRAALDTPTGLDELRHLDGNGLEPTGTHEVVHPPRRHRQHDVVAVAHRVDARARTRRAHPLGSRPGRAVRARSDCRRRTRAGSTRWSARRGRRAPCRGGRSAGRRGEDSRPAGRRTPGPRGARSGSTGTPNRRARPSRRTPHRLRPRRSPGRRGPRGTCARRTTAGTGAARGARSRWRNRAVNTRPPSTTAPLALNTMSGAPGRGSMSSTP